MLDVTVEVLHMDLAVSMVLHIADIHRVQVEMHTNQGQGHIPHILHKVVMKLQHLIIHIVSVTILSCDDIISSNTFFFHSN